MKLCIDCKHRVPGEPYGYIKGPCTEDKCGHPKGINPGTSKPIFNCEIQRSAPWLQAVLFGLCGKSGRWFELSNSPKFIKE